MAQEEQTSTATWGQVVEIEKLKRRLDMLDQRLDSIDTMVTAVAERVTRQPITFRITCPKCAKEIEVAVLGVEKPTG